MDFNLGRNLKQVLSVGFALLLIILLIYGIPKYWGDFTGLEETAVIQRLGNPLEIRAVDEVKKEKRTLVWQESLEVRLFLYFENGKVVAQKRYNR